MPKSKPPSPHSRRACKKAFPSAQFGAKRYALRWVTAATDGWSSELRFRLVGKSVGLKNGAALNLPRPMQLVPDGVWEICQVRRRSDKSFMCQFQHLASPPIPSIRIQPSRPAAAAPRAYGKAPPSSFASHDVWDCEVSTSKIVCIEC